MVKKQRRSMKQKVREDSQRSGSGSNYIKLPQGVGFFTAEAGGRCSIEILPYTVTLPKHPDGIEVGDIWYKRPYRRHRNVGASKDYEICPRSVGKPCPICDHRESLLESKTTDDKVIQSMKPQDRVLYNVRPLSGPDKGKILVWDFSFHNFQKQLDAEINDPENEEFAGFADLEGGYSLRVRFSEEHFEKNKYAKTERIDFDSKDDLDESILNEVVDLDKTLLVRSYKALQNKFFELDDTDDDTETDVPSEDDEKGTQEAEEQTEERSSTDRKRKVKPEEDIPVAQNDVKVPTKTQIKKMKRKELTDVISQFDLTDVIDADDYDDTDELREAVAIELQGKSIPAAEVTKPVADSKPKATPAKTTPAKTDKGKCPHGHKWGDADEHPECDDCDQWDDCIAAN
jgi:hypothetical protein